jgi:sialate O-acetylesterase
MIADWRERWGEGAFPFGIVSLANFMSRKPIGAPSAWAELREAQMLTSKNVPNTGLALAVDIGDSANIHPKNKQEVGRRLSLWALATTYGRNNLEYSGPGFVSMKPVKDSLQLSFSHVGKGLVALGGDSLSGFAVSNGDSNFAWAAAKIRGNNIVVWSPLIKQPKAVRYAWADNPACNLYNKDGLPAVPFRTDTLPGLTYRNR